MVLPRGIKYSSRCKRPCSQRVSPLGTETFVYDNLNRLTDQKLDSVIYAHVNYDSYSRVDNVTYPAAGSQKLQYTRDALGRTTVYTYTMGNGTTTVSDTVTKTQSNQTATDVVASGANSLWYNYSYDTAGRLTGMTPGPHTYSYGFGTQNTTTCGTGTGKNANSGKNSNRTTQTIDGTTTNFCYDYADRLIGSSDALYNGGDYDTHGNMTSLGTGSTPLRLCYDSSDRNSCMTQRNSSGTGFAMYYNRDVQGRVVARFKNTLTNWTASAAGDYYYGFTGSSDTPDFVRDVNWAVLEKNLQLPGGVLLTIRPAQSGNAQKQYSMPNIHGDTFLTTDAAGINTSNGNGPASSFTYDGFGNILSGSTFPANADHASYAYVGQHQKLTESEYAVTPMQMGARLYIPGIGRFMSVDPIEGGTPSSYVYPADPINEFDLTGTIGFKKWFRDRWSNTNSGIAKVQRQTAKVNAWCDRGYWNGVGCNAGLMAATMGRGKRGGSAKEFGLKIKIVPKGYGQRIPPQKVPFESHGQPAYKKGNKYITPDVDSHKGGAWKMIEMRNGQPNRLGTYNEDLTVRIGD
jgi:RHS repeat-associated protein